MNVIVVSCDARGDVDLADLRAKAEKHAAHLAVLMITYPSTHGVFEPQIRAICDIVHACGGQVYLDGANLNAQVGLARPGDYGADVSHILHKTFASPYGRTRGWATSGFRRLPPGLRRRLRPGEGRV